MLYLWGIYWWVLEPTLWKYIPWSLDSMHFCQKWNLCVPLWCLFFFFFFNMELFKTESKIPVLMPLFSDIFDCILNTCFCSILTKISRGSTFNIFESVDMTQSGFKLMLWRGWGQLRQLISASCSARLRLELRQTRFPEFVRKNRVTVSRTDTSVVLFWTDDHEEMKTHAWMYPPGCIQRIATCWMYCFWL